MDVADQLVRLTESVAAGRRDSPIRTSTIAEAVRLGMPTAEIAALAGITERRVRHIAAQAGLGRPTRGRPPKPKNGGGA